MKKVGKSPKNMRKILIIMKITIWIDKKSREKNAQLRNQSGKYIRSIIGENKKNKLKNFFKIRNWPKKYGLLRGHD